MVNSAPPGSLVNGSFEIPALGSGFQYNPSASGIGWTFSPNSGIQGNGSAWGAAPAPSGTQTAFIQGTGSITQTITLNAGSYTLSFQAAQRSCCVSPFVQPVKVSVDGTQIGGLISPASTSFAPFSIPFSVGTTGPHTITFTGTANGDKSTFIDNVNLVSGNQVATTTALQSSGTPSTLGTSVTFTATVNGGAPTGTVAFTADSTTTLCAAIGFTGGSTNAPTAVCSTSALSAGVHSIVATYSGDAGNSGSTSATLSQVVNSAPPGSLVNGSFEIPALGSGFQYNPSASGIGWTFSPNSGIQGNGSAWAATPAPSGTQTAFIQGNSSITQTITLNAGSYTLSFQAAQRPCCVSPFVQPVKVSVDGTQIGGLISPASTSFAPFSIPFSVGTTGPHTITFTGTANGDKSTFIDNVNLVSGNTSTDVVWVEDSVPAGAAQTSDGGDAWTWISSNPVPYSGALAHQSALASSEHQHYFTGATTTLAVAVGDTLYAYIYLDPVNPPSEIMLQWNDGSWEHRAYWGANVIPWGTDGTVSRRSMGALPATGQWVRLAVPAAQVGLEGSTLNGMAFTLYGGRATWDHAGKSSGGQLLPTNNSFEIPALGSGFQYNPSAPGIGWTFSPNSGIQGNGSAWGAVSAPSGTQTAFIQSTSSMTQTITLNAGSYTLSFQAAQRSCCVSPFVQPVQVSVDGAQIGNLISPASTSFAAFSVPFTVSTTGPHTVTFTGTDLNDKSTFIDNVTIQ